MKTTTINKLHKIFVNVKIIIINYKIKNKENELGEEYIKIIYECIQKNVISQANNDNQSEII